MTENNRENAKEANASKKNFNGLVGSSLGHLYAQLRREAPDELQECKLESNTLENFKRIHNMLGALSKPIRERATPAVEVGASITAGEAEKIE